MSKGQEMTTVAAATERAKPPDVRRRDLLDAGQRCFIEKGFAATTIEEITRGAGVAKGTFYLYFESKEDLLEGLRDRFAEGCRERIDFIAKRLAPDDWAGRLDAWVEGGIRHSLDHAALHDVVYRGGPHRHDSKAQNALGAEFEHLLRAGSAAGAWHVEKPEVVAVFLFYGLHGIVDYIQTKRTDRKAVIQLSQRIVRNTLGVNPS